MWIWANNRHDRFYGDVDRILAAESTEILRKSVIEQNWNVDYSRIFTASTTKLLLVVMPDAKECPKARVRFLSDWSVSKQFLGSNARERFENEICVLRFLESKLCHFVPRLIHADPNLLEIFITNCGAAIQHLSPKKLEKIFSSFESYGVRHEDPAIRNVTYRASDGNFCVVDFERASIIDESNAPAELFRRIDNQFDCLEQKLASTLQDRACNRA